MRDCFVAALLAMTPERLPLPQQVDPVRQDAGAEAVVDVHDRDAGGAGVQHGQQRGEAPEAAP